MLIDQHGRVVDYLRVSVTERCNFRCLYCMPEKPFSWVPRENLLSFEDLFKFIRIAMDEGVKKIRITGGEPTLRGDLDTFIRMIHDHNPEVDLALTTNGFLMPQYAKAYRDAGLKRINMSLDSLKKERVNTIAKKEVFDEVMKGIDASLDAGLKVKLNTVVMKGVNDDEIIDLIRFSQSKGIAIRFIEYMENEHADVKLKGVTSDEIIARVRQDYPELKEVPKDAASPAKYYDLGDGYQFGIIEPHGEDFCKSCNRIRLTAEGFLIPCLYFDEAMSIKDQIRAGDIDGAAQVLKELLANKPEKNRWSHDEGESSNRAFYQTGG